MNDLENLCQQYLDGANNGEDCIRAFMKKVRGFALWYAQRQPNLREDLICEAYLALCKVFIRKNRNFNDYTHLYNYMMMCVRSAMSRHLEMYPIIRVPRKKKNAGVTTPEIRTLNKDLNIIAPEPQEIPEIKIYFKDDKDRTIAEMLTQNFTYEEIGNKIGMTRPSVWERVNRMRRGARIVQNNN